MHIHPLHPTPTAIGFSNRATSGIERASQTAHQAVDRMAEAATSATTQLVRTGEQLLATQDRWLGAARDCVRDHPLASVGIALGVGLLLSRLTVPPHDED